jgi:hypothetical protein
MDYMSLISSLMQFLTGGIAGGASFYNNEQQQPEIPRQHDTPAFGYQPEADPMMAIMSMNMMSGLGGYDPNIYRQASPVNQLIAGLIRDGRLDQRDLKYLERSAVAGMDDLETLRAARAARNTGVSNQKGEGGLSYKDIEEQYGIHKSQLKMLEAMERAAIIGGYQNLDELFAEEEAYRAKEGEMRAQYEPVAEKVRQGLLASQGRVGEYLQNLPNLLSGGANPFTDQLREQAMFQAQRTGANPYSALEQADATALQRALGLISGEQAVYGQQHNQAMPIMALRANQGSTAAQIGAAQAQALADMLKFEFGAEAYVQQATAAALNQSAGYFGGGAESLSGLGSLGGGGGQRGPAA